MLVDVRGLQHHPAEGHQQQKMLGHSECSTQVGGKQLAEVDGHYEDGNGQ